MWVFFSNCWKIQNWIKNNNGWSWQIASYWIHHQINHLITIYVNFYWFMNNEFRNRMRMKLLYWVNDKRKTHISKDSQRKKKSLKIMRKFLIIEKKCYKYIYYIFSPVFLSFSFSLSWVITIIHWDILLRILVRIRTLFFFFFLIGMILLITLMYSHDKPKGW